MAIQNQGFRRDLNLKETEDDRTAFDNLAGSGTNKDIELLQNNLRNISSIPFFAVDSNGFFSTASDKIIGISSITATGDTDPDGNKQTDIQITLINSFLLKFGDIVKIRGITGAGSNIVNGDFSIRGVSNDLTTFQVRKTGVDYSETYTSVVGVTFSISSQDIFSFTKDDVVNVSQEVVSAGTTVLSPNVDYYVSEFDGLSKFKLSTSPSTVGFNTVVIAGGASLIPDNFQFDRKDAVHQQQLLNYIKPDIQDTDFDYLGGNSINGAMDQSQSNIESAEFFMGKKYRGCLLYTSPSPRDKRQSRMPSSA